MSVIIQKWSALKNSERALLMYGVPVILLAILYFYVWVPYNKSISGFQEQIITAQEDIAWLQQIGIQIEQLKSASPSTTGKFSGSFINVVDKSIKQNKLDKYVSLLEKSGEDYVVVKFDKINFDILIKFIGYVKKRYGILVKTIDVQRVEGGSLVNSRLILKKS